MPTEKITRVISVDVLMENSWLESAAGLPHRPPPSLPAPAISQVRDWDDITVVTADRCLTSEIVDEASADNFIAGYKRPLGVWGSVKLYPTRH